AAAHEYPYWQDYYSWRIKASYILCSVFAVQELAFFFLRRRLANTTNANRAFGILHYVCVLCWGMAGWWLVFYYFGT
ncbi:MAG TPA: hypothetical protein VET48_02805, partial [Steroidobacteraceae bacterium]|nr:hypothetical protein [Steroidobacteraceae bacterium]